MRKNNTSCKKTVMDALCLTKKISLIISLFVLGFAAVAQPSDANILNTLKAKSGAVISIKLSGSRKGIVKEFENGVKVSNFYRYYETKMKTEYAGVSLIYRGGVKYGYRGGSWKFIQKLIGDNSYTGVSNPTWGEIKPILTRNLRKTLGYDYNYIIGDIEEMRLADNPKWDWREINTVDFLVTMIYSKKINNAEVQKTQQNYKITLLSDGYKKPWKDFLSSSDGQSKNLGVKKYDIDELKKIATLQQIDVLKSSNAEIANLPKITIPSFANHGALVYFFHNMMLNDDELTIEAKLRKLLADGYYDANLKTVLTQNGVNLINQVRAQSKAYRQQYCKKPQTKHNQTNMTEWYNKDASSYSRLSSADLGNGKRAITEISLSVPKGTSALGKKLAAMACKVRSYPLKRMFATKLKSNVGSPVFCKYGKSEWYYIGTLAGTSNGGYKIKWLDNSTTVEAAASVCNFELIPGDLVYIKNSSGQIVQRWITENDGSYVVKVEDLNGRISSINLKDLRFK